MEQTPKQFTETDVLNSLEKEGVRIVKRPEPLLQVTIRSGLFEVENPKFQSHVEDEVEECIKACREYLSGSILADELDDHGARREWRVKMNTKYGKAFTELWSKNKLRLNNIAYVHLTLMTIAKGLEIFAKVSPESEKVNALYDRFPDMNDYDSKSLDEKIKFTQELDKICREFLTLVTKS